MHSARKSLIFNLVYTKKNFIILNFFKHIGLVKKFTLLESRNKQKTLKIYLSFYKTTSLCKTLKIISKPSHFFFISYRSLLLLHKKSYNSIFIIETPSGLLTHLTALKLRKGGKLWGFLSF